MKGVKAKLDDHLVVLRTIYGDIPCGADPDAEAIPEWVVEYLDGLDPGLPRSKSVTVNTATVESLNKKIELMWKLDSFPRDDSDSKLTVDEIAAVEKMEKQLIFDETSKRFKTRLLWRDEVDLQNNYFPARARLDSLLRRLRRDPCLGTAYRDSINEFIHQETVEASHR